MKPKAGIINNKQKTKALIATSFVVIGIVSAVVGIAPSVVCAQTAPVTCPAFGLERTTTYNLQGGAYAYGYAVATDSANNTYVTGEQYAPATGLDMYVIKYDQNGNVVWSDVYDVVTAGVSGNESGYGIAVMPDGSAVYVVGRQQDNASLNSDAFVRKYDATGAVVWTQVYDSGGAGADIARGAALDSAGNVYAAGYREKAGGGIEAMLLSYTAAGGSRFAVAYTVTNNASAFGVAVSGTAVYMTGYTQTTGINTDMFVRKYNTAGVLMTTFGTSGMVTYDSLTTMPKTTKSTTGAVWAYCPSGSTMMNATSTGTGVITTDIPANGCRGTDAVGTTPASTCTFDCSSYMVATNNTDIGYGITVEAGGTIFVTGYQDTKGGDSFLRKYIATGGFVWGEVYNSGGTQNDVGRGIVGGKSERIFVTGRQQTNNEDAFLGEHHINQSQVIVSYADVSASPQVICIDHNIGFVYEINGSLARLYVMGTNGDGWWGFNCGNDPGYWNVSDGKKIVYEFDWNDIPPEISAFTAIADNPVFSYTFTRNTPNNERYRHTAAYCVQSDGVSCGSGGPQTVSIGVSIDWQDVLGSVISSFLYRGDQAGAPEYNEMAFGVARTNSTMPAYTATADDVYVVGYQASNGGEAFLNKYSCSGAQAAVGASLIANFTATPTSGPDPLTVNVDARASAGTIAKYEWDWDYDGTTFDVESTGSLASHVYDVSTYLIPGTYTIALRVTTSSNTTDIATRVINVSANIAPIAAFKVCDLNNNNCVASTLPPGAPFTGVAPLRVNVDGAASTDPNAAQGGYVKSFSWSWGDGTVSGVGEKATHLYSAPGPYTITLTVTDNGGLTNTTITTQNVSVIDQYVCTTGGGPGGSCIAPTPVCGPTETVGATQCYACRADNNCGVGYQCLGTSCAAGTQCASGVACPADGRCPEVVACNPLASGATCPDGSLCPASGFCPAAKNICSLSGSAVDTQCYVEEQGSCVINADCTESITGGVCDAISGACRYARCSNETGLACTIDNDCADGDGICNGGTCVYIYDCAYGPGMGSGVTGQYATSTPDAMPKMPTGVQPDGQACTQPTPDAPNNCEGINGCLYYNYYSASGTPIANSNNSVANCVNTFEGGTGCAYYQYYSSLAVGSTPTTKTNCLPRYAERSKKAPQAGIPDGCFVVDKGTRGKEYNCTAIDGCYYYLDGRVDCTYKEVTATACTTNAECAAASTLPLMIPVCNVAAGLCEYQGNGCLYEPNPKGAIACPGATSPATGGDNFVQCMLNPDSVLPGFLNTANNALSSCSVNADCPTDNICLNGTCYPQCQANVDCASGEQCTTTCTTSLDCAGGLVCNAGICVPPQCASGTPSGTLLNVTTANLGLTTSADSSCKYSTSSTDSYTAMTLFDTTGTTSHSESLSGLTDGSYAYYVLCQELSSSVLAGMCQINFNIATISCIPGTICPNAAVCPASGICPTTVPACAGAFPTGNLPFGTTSTTMGLTTAQPAACSYSLVAIDPYASMTPFGTTGTTSHSTTATGLFTGPNTYYAKCQDASSGTITNACAISFNVGTTCTSSAMCPSGFMCIAGTCQPPVCENASPTGALAPGISSTTISLTTDTDANCRYSTNGGDAYDTMMPFASTGLMSHTSLVMGLVTGGNTHYVRCQDAVTSAEKFCQIPFSVGVCNSEFKCDTGFMCIPNTGTGMCVPVVGCVPGTYCPDGALCPANGVCPLPPCVLGDYACPPTYCPYGTVYSATSGICENCAINPGLPGCGEWGGICDQIPPPPICVGGGPGGVIAIPSGTASCNTLGYTFTGTAITPSGNCDLVAIILALLSWMAWIIALLAVLSGLRAAYLYITSMGDEKKLILARRYLIYTTLGVAVAVLTFSIVAITRVILNI
ncbi:MAG: PKD domain-containing protein [Patescibacteria group bacterium]